MALQTDELLHGRYRIVRALKQGGMGAVYEALDTKLANSPCAVKEISDEARAGSDRDYIEARFFEEMKALSALDHPCIPRIRDFLQLNSSVYIVMDLVRGPNLEEELRQRQAVEPERVVRDVICLLETLSYLHHQQPPVLHRDVKPANILRDERTGCIKLVDFGLARELTSANHTAVGTLGYCAPEQMMGQAVVASDLFSVGVTLNQLLTGQSPDLACFEPLRPQLPEWRPGLAGIIEKATQLKPSQRYSSAEEMAEALRAWVEGRQPVTRWEEPLVVPSVAPPSRGAHALFATAAILALSLGLWLRQPPPTAGAAVSPTGASSPPSAAPALSDSARGGLSSSETGAHSGNLTGRVSTSGSSLVKVPHPAGPQGSAFTGRPHAVPSVRPTSSSATAFGSAGRKAPHPEVGDTAEQQIAVPATRVRPGLGGGPAYPVRVSSVPAPAAAPEEPLLSGEPTVVPAIWERPPLPSPVPSVSTRGPLERLREERAQRTPVRQRFGRNPRRGR